MKHKEIIEKLNHQQLTKEDLDYILNTNDQQFIDALHQCAREKAQSIYGNNIYIRGLIEFTNYCHNDCLYCGIRASQKHIQRFRLSKEEILMCCHQAYDLGFRTFVLQGGEDLYFNDEMICDIVSSIKNQYPDCAITLSIGEKLKESYQAYYNSGANRFLLRHETASKIHYERLHPSSMSYDHRIRCLKDLKEIGYQTGCGFMVGSPYQSVDTLYQDLMFIRELQPEMVGIGPFIPAHDTPFENEKAGSVDTTIRLLSVIRLLHPHVLLPATTALGTIDPQGREKGILAGANVIMPNISPSFAKENYQLYNKKLCTGQESIEGLNDLKERMEKIHYHIVCDRGDYKE